jgi:hypothetical protein
MMLDYYPTLFTGHCFRIIGGYAFVFCAMSGLPVTRVASDHAIRVEVVKDSCPAFSSRPGHHHSECMLPYPWDQPVAHFLSVIGIAIQIAK